MRGVEVVALAIFGLAFFFALARHSDGVVTFSARRYNCVFIFIGIIRLLTNFRTFYLHNISAGHLG